ncbi:MAG TPA: PHB depolymerase family esterase [Candidatus Limnocylindria bacterium]|nr:PHB depolymerase family esterase [Candidatus Limnocylindria bacterium]
MRRALQADSSQAYFVYVSKQGGQGAPIFVTVHGISRNVEEHAMLFAPYAEKYGVVLVAPFFTKDGNPGYQWLGREPSGRRADMTLDAIIQEVAVSTGAEGKKLYLFGFSGGAQFAHRYTLAHPDRVARTAVGAAGWYTFPDRRTPYPYGLGPSRDRPSVRFEPEKFLRVPITVLVGENDTGDEHLRQSAIVDRRQGKTRLDRAQNWVAAMRRAAEERGLSPLVTCERVPGIEHSFKQFMERGKLGDKVFEALFGSSRTLGDRR